MIRLLRAAALLWATPLLLEAAETSFDSLAFVPDPAAGPQVTLPDHPALNWTRVAFRPQRTNDFPEELKPLRTLPSPAAQITGLAAAGEHLWVVSAATRRIYRLDPNTGAIQADFPCPGESPAGLSHDGQWLWHADRAAHLVFALDPAGKVVKRFEVPFEPSALLPFAGALLVSDWQNDKFHRLDPQTGAVLATQRAPDNHLTGLVALGRYLWCSRGEELICFDPDRSLPVCGFSAAPAKPAPCVLAGLADDGSAFWVANAPAGQLVRLPRPAHGQWVGGAGRIRQAGFEMTYRNTSNQPLEPFTVLQHVPFLEMPGQRYLALHIDPAPRAFFRDDLGNVIALLDFGRLPPGQTVPCHIATTMWVADRRLVVDPDLVAGPLSPQRQAYARKFHPIPGEDSPEVKSFVKQAVGPETNAYWQVRKAHDALCAAIYYREPADESVPGVLHQGYGVCRNYSAAMESFGRLLGVPVLNAWAPHHETCLLLFPGLSPAVLEVTANDSGPDPATAWRRSRWFLGTSAGEITTGARGYAMHTPLSLDGVPYAYRWHYWLPTALHGLRHEGWWTITDPGSAQPRRL